MVFVFHLVVEKEMISNSEQILRAVDLFVEEGLHILKFEIFSRVSFILGLLFVLLNSI
jgi:hypothetical protein